MYYACYVFYKYNMYYFKYMFCMYYKLYVYNKYFMFLLVLYELLELPYHVLYIV